MKYFLDTEFLEGTQKKLFGETKPTIDLISIGIVAEDGREYYAISKDFNLKEAWNRYDWKRKSVSDGIAGAYKVYWIRDNVLKPIYNELASFHINYTNYGEHKYFGHATQDNRKLSFCYTDFKWLISKYGKSNKQIAKEIRHFVANRPIDSNKEEWILEYDTKDVQFYGYYSDYDWVVFCWLFGKMIDLPNGFPMYCIDLKQQIEEYNVDKEQLLKEVPQENIHNSLEDARWNYKAYNRIQHKINNNV